MLKPTCTQTHRARKSRSPIEPELSQAVPGKPWACASGGIQQRFRLYEWAPYEAGGAYSVDGRKGGGGGVGRRGLRPGMGSHVG